MSFYNRLQEISMGYILALVSFDVIILSAQFEGLYPLGLGLI